MRLGKTYAFVSAVSALATIVFASGCNSDTRGIAERIQGSCGQERSERTYFLDLFALENDSTEARARDVWKLLATLGEPPLACAGKGEEVYRLLYMPEGAASSVIRAERTKTTYTVTVRHESWDGNSPQSTTRNLSAAGWHLLIQAIDEYGFWSRPPHPAPATPSLDLIVVHGPAWVLEGRDSGWYHAVSRTSILKERAFDAPARVLFELAGLEVPGIIKSRPW